jgi:ABC-2 family transporter protein
MFTFLIPLYYLVSKFAEEKESKSREGMKMMGLKDSTYFLSWFVFYAVIIIVMSTVITLMVSINLFPNSNKFLIFMMSFFYGLSLFGFSLVVVSILPTVRSSATAATLFHLISFFLVFPLRDPDVSPVLKIVMSLFPNVGMSFCVFNLYQFEANASGLSFGNISQWYNNMTFINSLTMLIIDTIFYLCLGLYLDQIL